MRGKQHGPSGEDAALLALKALQYLAAEPGRLENFLRVTGVDIEALREEAHTQRLQAAVLDHLLQDESLLLAFTANAGVPPAEVARARTVLARDP